MLNRREFVSILAAASATLKVQTPLAEAQPFQATKAHSDDSQGSRQNPVSGGFPVSDYTPFGYLDNPWHTWNMHPSGVLRSLPGIGFGLYYPAGPGGYFDYQRNGVYSAEIALGFRIGGHTWMEPNDFEAGQLTARHHTKNLLAYAFKAGDVQVECAFFQVNEDALAVEVTLTNQSASSQNV